MTCDTYLVGLTRSGCCALAAAALAWPALLAMTGCAPSTACAGQCAAPYQLQVEFKTGTPAHAAEKVLMKCARMPDVIRVGKLATKHGTDEPEAIIFTRHFGKSARTSRLFTCIHSSRVVSGAGYPG